MSIIERSWRTIEELAFIMSLHAGLGEDFWEEATMYAVNILNCITLPKPDTKGKRVPPYEKLYHKRPILNDL